MNNMLIEIVRTVKQQGNPFILKYSIVIIFSSWNMYTVKNLFKNMTSNVHWYDTEHKQELSFLY